MDIKALLITALVVLPRLISAQNKNSIILELETDKNDTSSYTILTRDIHLMNDQIVEKPITGKYSQKGIVKWRIHTEFPLLLKEISKVRLLPSWWYFLQPSDSIRIRPSDTTLIFSGTGATKMELYYKAAHLPRAGNTKPKEFPISIHDYLTVLKEYEEMLKPQLSLINKYQGKIPDDAFLYAKYFYLNDFRSGVFPRYYSLIQQRKSLDLSYENLLRIYDSTLKKYLPGKDEEPDAASIPITTEFALRYYIINEWGLQYAKKGKPVNDFDRYSQYYAMAKERFKGLAQRKVLVYTLKYFLRDHMSPEAITAAKDFLSMPGYEWCRQYVAGTLAGEVKLRDGNFAPEFTVVNAKDEPLSLKSLRGKIVFLDFWFTGCRGCIQMAEVLRTVEKEFEDDDRVAFLNISIDKNKAQWLASIKKKKYTTGTAINLYTSGKGDDHPINKDYRVTSYPSIFLIGQDQRLIRPVPDPREDSGRALITKIRKLLPPSPADGPYLLYKEGKVVLKVVKEDKAGIGIADSLTIGDKSEADIPMTDIEDKTFILTYKKELKQEPAVYNKPSKVFAVSDIEGNFIPFKKLLQAGKVIDENFNWTFGNGHLVLAGDFFDRGYEVTETLWLIYSMEEKAKAAGGYVHFILGNHEIMNLSGDLSYVHQKYKNTAKLLNEDYSKSLYGENSELGRWLRTKNVMEKIGDVLVTHAGISPEINKLDLNIEQINSLSRSYYDKSSAKVANEKLAVIFSTKKGPFWYRGYYKDKNVKESQIDSTLRKFGISKIITGHTLVEEGDRITTHFGNKVINTDTHHSKGKSEALLIENHFYYRVNIEGTKKLLFTEQKAF